MKFAQGTGTLHPGGTWGADEAGTCAFTGTRAVAHGAGTYTYKTAPGSTACTSASFGGAPPTTIKIWKPLEQELYSAGVDPAEAQAVVSGCSTVGRSMTVRTVFWIG